MDDHPSRRSCRLVLVAVAAVLAALAMVPAAGAHARLIATEPANDAVLEQSPRFVLLRFDEPVETAFGAIRVYDARARRVDSGEVARPSEREARIALDRRLGRGTYTATWRAVSADGHPVSGAFVFHVGAPGANPAGVAAQVLEGGTPASVSVLFSIVRALDFLLLLLVGGGTLMLIVGLARALDADTAAAVAAPCRSRVSAGDCGAHGDRAAGSGGGRLRPARSVALGRRLGCARDAVRDGVGRAGRAGACVCGSADSERARARARLGGAVPGCAGAADTVAVGTRKRLRQHRAGHRHGARHGRRGLGRRPRCARARPRLGR